MGTIFGRLFLKQTYFLLNNEYLGVIGGIFIVTFGTFNPFK